MRGLLVCLLVVGVAAAGWWWIASADDVAVPTDSRGDPGASASPGNPAARAGADDGEPGSAPSSERSEAGASLRGRLTQAGAALANAEVVLFSGQPWQAVEVARTETDAHGAFSFPAQSIACRITSFDVRVPLPWTARCGGARPRGHDLGELQVPVPGVIEGRVVDPFGAGVAAAEVLREVSPYQYVRFEGAAARPSTKTDAQGRFRFERVQPEDHATLVCVADGFAIEPRHPVDVAAGAVANTEIQLRAGGLLRGIVLGWQGQPLAGAEVSTEYGRRAQSDALGQFVIEHMRGGADVRARAPGHIDAEVENVFDTEDVVQLQLRRAVRLRGVVHGTDGRPGTVHLDTVFDGREDSQEHAPYRFMYKDLEILRDGRFVIDGLSCSDWDLSVRVPGVGAVGPVRVELRDDTELELTLVPEQVVSVVVRDQGGAPIVGAVLVDDGPRRTEYGYQKERDRLRRIEKSKELRERVELVDGQMRFGRARGQRVAFAVYAEGYRTETRVLEPDDERLRVEVTMLQTGAVRGVVHGGRRGDYGASVRFWPADAQPNAKAGFSIAIAADGTFAKQKVLPGDYRAAVSRYGRMRPGEKEVSVPMFDTGVDLRGAVDCRVVAGAVATLELTEPKLGVLRGRVVLRGRPVAGVAVVAERPRQQGQPSMPSTSMFGSGDWDDTMRIRHTDGMHTDANGAFEMLYRDAGPVLLRARHPDADATSAPLLVELPPPGEDVVRDLSLPLGEIRGVFPIEAVPEKQRKAYEVGLFPLHKAGEDPYHDPGSWSVSIAWDCARAKAPEGGRFAFRFLPPGAYVVRVHDGDWRPRMLWQQVVEVHEDVADLGPIEVAADVRAQLRWKWQEGAGEVGKVGGFWLSKAHGDQPTAVWVGTVAAANGKAELSLPPGSYTGVAFVAWDRSAMGMLSGLSGVQNARPVPFEIRSDGSVVPDVLTLSPQLAEAEGAGKD